MQNTEKRQTVSTFVKCWHQNRPGLAGALLKVWDAVL